MENEEKKVRIVNKRIQAVFTVPLKEARELLDNFSEIVETKDELPKEPEPEKQVNPDELKILGAEEKKENGIVETKDENKAKKAEKSLN